MEEFKIHKCKNCGGDLDYSQAVNGVIKCNWCPSVFTVPKSNSKATSYLDMGAYGLDTCNFDDSYTAYQKAAEIDKKEPEAYFGMALATAQVQYLKDYVNNRMQPIVHAISEKSFLQDNNYKKALECATQEQKLEYTAKAKEIDDIRRQFYELKKSGLKYDCFICVKVTEDGGRHTEDSHIASTLYHKLQDAGYSPFYSEEEIKGRTGADYEALILYALHNSPSMLLVCTDESYLQTPWVKNEYTRYLNMLNQEEKHRDSLTIVFKDSVIEKLPGIYGKIQGVPFNTYDALPRIIDFVDRFVQRSAPEIIRKEYGRTSYKKKSVIKQGITKRQLTAVAQGEVTVSDKAKLAIAADFLKRCDYENTIRFCSNLVAENPSNSEAYWMMFLAENQCSYEGLLVNLKTEIHNFDNYEKAIASAIDEDRKKYFYNALYYKVKDKKYLSEYKEYVELPDSPEENITSLTKLMCEKALQNKDAAIFDEVIKTVTDTDNYISMNLKFAKEMNKKDSVKYYQNILQVDAGHNESLWQIFKSQYSFDSRAIFEFCANEENYPIVEEKLFAYGFNETATKSLFDLCFRYIDENIELCSKFFDFILSLIPKDNDGLCTLYINRFVNKLLKAKKISFVEKYVELAISIDKYNDNAYFNRCLVKRGLYNSIGLVKYIDNILSDEDYFTAINIYTEKHPNEKNLYLDIYYALDKLNLKNYPYAIKYVYENIQYERKEDLLDCNNKIISALNKEANTLYQDILLKYRAGVKADLYKLLSYNAMEDERWNICLEYAKAGKNDRVAADIEELLVRQPKVALTNQADKMLDDILASYGCHHINGLYNLQEDVTSDKRWKDILDFATNINYNDLIAAVKNVLREQANVAKDNIKHKKQKRNYERIQTVKQNIKIFTTVFSIVCALSVIVTLIMAMAGVSKICEFWLIIFQNNQSALYGVGIALLIIPMLILLIAMFSGLLKGKRKTFSLSIIIILIVSVLCFSIGIWQWSKLGTEESSYYIGDGYICKMSWNGEGYAIEKYSGRIKSVVLPSEFNNKKVVEIGESAFNGCKEIITVKLPNNLKVISMRAFKKCIGIEEIIIPNGVQEIGSYAFTHCKNLKRIYIPKSVEIMGSHVFSEDYSYDSAMLKNLNVYCEVESAPSGWNKDWRRSHTSTGPFAGLGGCDVFSVTWDYKEK